MRPCSRREPWPTTGISVCQDGWRRNGYGVTVSFNEIARKLASSCFATKWRWGTKPRMQLAAGCDATIRPSSAGNLNLKLGAPRSSVNGIKSVRLAKLQDSRALACVARDMRGAVPPRIISLARIPGTKLLLVGTVTAAAVRHGKERLPGAGYVKRMFKAFLTLRTSRSLDAGTACVPTEQPPADSLVAFIGFRQIASCSDEGGSVTSPSAALDGWLHRGWNAMTGRIGGSGFSDASPDKPNTEKALRAVAAMLAELAGHRDAVRPISSPNIYRQFDMAKWRMSIVARSFELFTIGSVRAPASSLREPSLTRFLSHTEMNDMGSPSTPGPDHVRGTTRKPIMDGMKPWGAKSKDKASNASVICHFASCLATRYAALIP
ncbi:hypothetical protein AK812_SmicGene31363 [Symbiodinium microadriaticum]|uniref:Uncharacterized protein n=1 Tax=Symbiodinium microadriaticum TaxID=2951 RepID=A0A1Q9CWW8_SYMMI|nr:hypothetical protein AK812_SmicGene31363 [Symbiodinium microadriaticum]